MKKFINIILIGAIAFNTFGLLLNDVNATTSTVTVTGNSNLNVRKGAGTNYSVAGVLNYNNAATLISTTKYSGTGCSAGWYKIEFNGSTTRYVCSSYVKINTAASSSSLNSSDYYTMKNWNARINENYINIRSGASTSYSVQTSLYLGTDVEIIGSASSTSGCSAGWYKIKYLNNKTGYVCKSFVDAYNNVTAYDSSYNKTLQDAGFPSSYWPYLTYLHKKYPNWKFKAIKTDRYFSTAVNSETGKNYIQSSLNSYRESNTLKEKPNWYSASAGVVAFYLDPRNYLNDKNIFVFENLSYDKTNHTSSIVSSIFSGSYLNTTTYVNYFMKAASSYNISPIHLASRVKQEGGTNSSYSAVSGKVTSTWNDKSLKGIYNYYNIGAYGSDPVTRGLAAAAGYIDSLDGTPWNTREKSILYGAKYIANGYINAGQNTLYFQKFNTSPSSKYSAYTHQYMTNVTAPTSESNSTYDAYKKIGLLSKTLSFSIPVYTNMPSYSTSLPPVGDTNNNLSSISVNGTKLNNFDSDVISYSKYITSDTNSVTLSAISSSKVASISGTGKINTSGNSTTASIIVKPEVGSSKTYKITFIKTTTNNSTSLNVNQIINKMSVKYSGSYLSNIQTGTTTSNLTSMVEKVEPRAKISISNSSGKSKTGKLGTGDKVTITSNNETKTLQVSVKGDVNGDGSITAIDLLKTKKYILGYSKLSGANKDAIDVNYDSKINTVDLLKIKKHILGYIKIK